MGLLSASIRSISQLGNPAPKPSVLVFPLARATAGTFWGVCGCTCGVNEALEVYSLNAPGQQAAGAYGSSVRKKRRRLGASPYLWRL